MTRGTRNKQVGLAAIISALAVITGISAHANTAPHNYAQPGIVAPEQEFKTDDSTGGFSLGGDMVQPSSLVPALKNHSTAAAALKLAAPAPNGMTSSSSKHSPPVSVHHWENQLTTISEKPSATLMLFTVIAPTANFVSGCSNSADGTV